MDEARGRERRESVEKIIGGCGSGREQGERGR